MCKITRMDTHRCVHTPIIAYMSKHTDVCTHTPACAQEDRNHKALGLLVAKDLQIQELQQQVATGSR